MVAAGGAISAQVLSKLAAVARRQMQMPWADIRAFLGLRRGVLTVHPLTLEVHDTGLALAERHGLSVYDAMIAASAVRACCDTLWSADMQDGMVLEGEARIINPFRTAG